MPQTTCCEPLPRPSATEATKTDPAQAARARPIQALEHLGYRVLGYQSRELEVVRFDPARHAELWDAFIPRTVNGNLFHTRRFLNYHPPGRFEDHSLLFFDKGELICVAPGEAKDGRWSAHRYSSHGGLAVIPNLRADRCLDIVHGLIRYALDAGWHSLSMRFAPACLHRGNIDPLLWALEIFGFRETGKELAWCFMPPAAASEEQLLSRYANGAHYATTKAIKDGLTVRVSEDFPAYWALLEGNLQRKFTVAPTHSLEEIQRIRELCPGEIALWAVFNPEHRMIAGSVIFEVAPNAGHMFYSAQDYAYQELRPTSLFMHELHMEYVVRRQGRLNLGVITAHGAEELNLGLSWFKQSYAAQPFVRRSYSLDIDASLLNQFLGR
jgi:hypothetical protein